MAKYKVFFLERDPHKTAILSIADFATIRIYWLLGKRG